MKVAVAIVAGSIGLMPYNCDSTERPRAKTDGRTMKAGFLLASAASSTWHLRASAAPQRRA
jgi:hypothetical protein